MAEGRRNLLVGGFVLVGFIALGSLIVLFGRGPTWLVRGGTYPIEVSFDRAAGVRTGTLVTLNGITIGRVEAVEMAQLDTLDAGVVVTVSIDERYRLPKDTTAQTTEPVLGQGRPPIEILPGPSGGEFLAPGARISGVSRQAIDTIFPRDVVEQYTRTAQQIGDAAEALTPVLEELEVMLAARSPSEVDRPGGPQGNLSSAMARLDASLRHFNEVLGDPEVKSELRATVANLKSMSERGTEIMTKFDGIADETRKIAEDARKMIAEADTTIKNADGHMRDLSQGLLASLDKVDGMLDQMDTITRQVAAGEGNLGRFVMDDKLYESLLISAERMSLAVDEIRALVAEWREGKVRVAF